MVLEAVGSWHQLQEPAASLIPSHWGRDCASALGNHKCVCLWSWGIWCVCYTNELLPLPAQEEEETKPSVWFLNVGAARGSALSVDICAATAVAVSLSTVCVHVSLRVYLWRCICCPCFWTIPWFQKVLLTTDLRAMSWAVSFDSSRNSRIAIVDVELPYQRLLLPDQGGEWEIITHPLTALEYYLPEL